MYETLNTFKANSDLSSSQSLKLFRAAQSRSRLGQVWARISRSSNRLLDLNDTLAGLKVRGRHAAASQAVLIEKIRGTEGRLNDFDAHFNPLNEQTRDRWLSIASARLGGASLPAVDLIQVGEVYFVRDGHHRISVALALGEQAIDAHVTVYEVESACSAPAGLCLQAG